MTNKPDLEQRIVDTALSLAENCQIFNATLKGGMMNTVILEIRKFDDVLDDVANAREIGRPATPRISFETVGSLWKIISPKKMEILQSMAGAGALGVREVARRVARDVRAVHRDLQALIVAGIVRKTADGKQVFPYDEIHVDFTLSGVA